MRALVIGGCGFVGSSLVDHLLLAGHSVVIVDPMPKPADCYWLGVAHLREMPLPKTVLQDVLAQSDIVYYLATSTTPASSQRDPLGDIEDNLAGIVKFMNVMQGSSCRRIVYFSSGGTVYGNSKKRLARESDNLDPICSYGVVKVAIEKYLGMCRHHFDVNPIILRPANAYGPRQKGAGAQGLVAASLSHAIDGSTIEIWGDGLAIRDYIYVDDLVRLACAAGESQVPYGIFNAGSGVAVAVNDVLKVVGDVVGSQPDIVYRSARPFDVRRIVLSSQLSERTFGWRSQVSLGEGVARCHSHLLGQARFSAEPLHGAPPATSSCTPI